MAASSGALCLAALDRIVERFDLAELHTEDLASPMSPEPVGALRVLDGDPVHRAVYIGLTVEAIGLDSHMLFAFTAPGSPVPHFTLDSVQAQGSFAFHLDLIPRVELATNLAYMDEVYGPLTGTAESARAIDGLTPAHLSMRQYAVMSPWMLVHRATPEAFEQVDGPVDAYLDRWFALAEKGIESAFVVDDLAARDDRHRRTLFDPDVDKVWGNVARLLGDETSERLRMTLVAQ